MSFSRARIQRFNDIKAATPSKVTDALTVKAACPRDKCLLEQSPSTIPIQNVASFRTPTIPKKKKTLVTERKVAPTDIFKCQEATHQNDVLTGNSSPDDYSRSLIAQIEDMKKQLFVLENQKKQLLDEQMQFEEKCMKLKEEHTATIGNITQEFKTNCDILQTKINELSFDINELKGAYSVLESKMQESTVEYQKNLAEIKKLHENDLNIYKGELQSKNTLLEEKERQLKTLLVDYKNLNDKHQEEIIILQKNHELNMHDMQFDLVKSLTELQSCINKINCDHARAMQELEEKKSSELFEMQQMFNKEKEQLRKESVAKITQVEENCYEVKILAEIQMTEKCNDIEANWKLRLEEQEKQADAILKECQAISEYNIIQCELEKNKIKQELLEKTKILEEFKTEKTESCSLCSYMEEQFLVLKLELNSTISKLSEECEHLQEELEVQERQLETTLADKKIYEISFNKIHKTIEALKNRLLHSDGDVEQLKKELENCESQKLEVESKCNQLTAELELVNKLNDDLEIQQEKHLKENEEYIASLEKDLIADVETYRLIAIQTVSQLKKQLDDKNTALTALEQEKITAEKKIEHLNKDLQQNNKDYNEILDQLHEQQKITSNVQMSIGETVLGLNQLEKKYEVEINKLKSVIAAKDEQIYELQTNKTICDGCNEKEDISSLLKQINQLQDKSASYYQYCEYYKNKSKEYEEEIEDLSKIRKQYIEQSGKYDTLLQKYDILKKKMEEQKQSLESQKYLQCNENSHCSSINLAELSSKHDEVLKKNHKMEKKLASQTKIIEKLRKELSALTQSPKKLKSKSDKENINSPNCVLNSSLYGSPLRERN